MKFNLKMIAIASAMVSMAGAAHADLQAPGSNNGSLAIGAFNTVTRAFYLRDTGFLMNSFLPTGVTTLSGDGSVAGNKTPEAGLVLDKTNTASFADVSFSGWLSGQNTADVKWFVSSFDAAGTSTTTNVKRMITSSLNLAESAFNSNIDQYINSGRAGGLGTIFGTGGLSSFSSSGAPVEWDDNFGIGADSLASLGDSAGLFYFSRTVGTGTTGAVANGGAYGNSLNQAVITLAANGDFSYTLAAAEAPSEVPVPAAVWLLGSGLMALGGAARRRKAAAKA